MGVNCGKRAPSLTGVGDLPSGADTNDRVRIAEVRRYTPQGLLYPLQEASNPSQRAKSCVGQVSQDARLGVRRGAESRPQAPDVQAEAGTTDMGKEYESVILRKG